MDEFVTNWCGSNLLFSSLGIINSPRWLVCSVPLSPIRFMDNSVQRIFCVLVMENKGQIFIIINCRIICSGNNKIRSLRDYNYVIICDSLKRPFETDCRIFTTLFGLILTHLFDWHSLKLFFQDFENQKLKLDFITVYYYRHRIAVRRGEIFTVQGQ